MKSITMSVRVSAEDAQFIAELEVPGATTPSEKLRAIIAEARERHRGDLDYNRAVLAIQQMLGPARGRVRAAEHERQVHSDLVATVFDWLPEALASAITPPKSGGDSATAVDLLGFESVLAEQVFRLVDSILRMGVTARCRCYEPQAVASRIGPVVEVARLIDASVNTRMEGSP